MHPNLHCAIQINHRLRFASCATHSHSLSVVFAVAKTAWLSSCANGAAITSTSKWIVKRYAFANHCCGRYAFEGASIEN